MRHGDVRRQLGTPAAEIHRSVRPAGEMEVGMPWDFSGVWVVNGKFEVKSAPRPEFDPPGFYPSPHETGRWELWTGVAWSGTFQDGPIPRR